MAENVNVNHENNKLNGNVYNAVRSLLYYENNSVFGHFSRIECYANLSELVSNLLDIRSKIWGRFIIHVLPI